ncbi:Ribosomal protein S18 acetylase RimI [Terribacillus aidingensis]|uniref:Ribosomal protein S18 acetylase RimI n=1 Tax=Terribacillus aidingensis TaxID=586416 RepID=A0A285NLQ4_9BACI|nr:GNAT family N-acetyltransferase [Terribacillus aidingensis]SNZ10168.1 Ribosomal protein S18 acetylase RimI [Terribacillus aidingensis]
MSLHAKPVLRNIQDIQILNQINNEAFPLEERIPFDKLIELADHKHIDLLAFYDKERIIGFVVMVIEKPCAYIFFLAIDSNHRSKGYGSEALQMLTTLYPEYQIVMDLEPIEVTAENNEQRLSRKKFYLRNGYYETGYRLKYVGISFEILCNKKMFNKESFITLLDKIKPELNKIKTEKFEPVLFKI